MWTSKNRARYDRSKLRSSQKRQDEGYRQSYYFDGTARAEAMSANIPVGRGICKPHNQTLNANATTESWLRNALNHRPRGFADTN